MSLSARRLLFASSLLLCALPQRAAADALSDGFAAPPRSAGTWVYWWWLNGYVSKEGIVRDLDAMRAQGISGALVFHAGTGFTPSSTTFMSTAWRDLFSYAVQEAAKREIEISLNLCDGWNAGGPWVTANEAARTLHSDVISVSGPTALDRALPTVPTDREHFRELFVLAWRCDGGACASSSMVDLTANVQAGRLSWQVPAGSWQIVRFGSYVHSRAHTKVTGGPSYLEIDPLSKAAMKLHFDNTALPLANALRSHVGTTFTHVHIDSGELGNPDWTPQLIAEFQRLRGYDPRPYLATKAGLVVDDALITTRFGEDYQRTVSELWVEAYHRSFAELAAAQGLAIHPEAAGYQKPPVDALSALGASAIPMGEFWSRHVEGSNTLIHQLAEQDLLAHDSIKNASCAASAYDRALVQAEAFTVIRPDNYSVELFELKDVGDRAYCQGMTRPLLTLFVHQPQSDDQAPGYTWPGVGTTFTRMDHWWTLGGAWVRYLNRCNHMQQHGQIVADFCYLQGDQTPSFVPAKWAMDPPLPAGADMMVINSEVLITSLQVDSSGELLLPGGRRARYLVLWQGGPWRRDRSAASSPSGSGAPLELSPAAWAKIVALVQAGATLVGPPPSRAFGLADRAARDAQVVQHATTLWGSTPGRVGQRSVGKGRVIWGASLDSSRTADGLAPDLEVVVDRATAALDASAFAGMVHPSPFDWIHRREGTADHYFVANLTNASAGAKFTFRAAGRLPELWDPITGAIEPAPRYQRLADGRVALPLDFAPRQSRFVVFRANSSAAAGTAPRQSALAARSLEGPWQVSFDSRWGGPASTSFAELVDWAKHDSAAIRSYSGEARYETRFTLPFQPSADQRVFLDLGELHSSAEVTLNGAPLGVRFAAPWHLDVTDALVAGDNTLGVRVATTWRNRIAADIPLPASSRVAFTNVLEDFVGTLQIHTLAERQAALSEPHPAGLIGPVSVELVGAPHYTRAFADTYTPSRGRSRRLDDNLRWRSSGFVEVARYAEGRTTNTGAAATLGAWQTQLRGGKLQLSGDLASAGSMVWAGPDHDFAPELGPTYRVRFSLTPDSLPKDSVWVALTLGEKKNARGAWVLSPHGGLTLLFRANGEWLVLDGGNAVVGTTQGATTAGARMVELAVEDTGSSVRVALEIDGLPRGDFTASTTFRDENYLTFAGWIGDGLLAGQVVGHTVDDLEIVDTSRPPPPDGGVLPFDGGAVAGDGASDGAVVNDGAADGGSPGASASDGGCGCQTSAASDPALLGLALLLLWGVRRRGKVGPTTDPGENRRRR